MPRHRVMQRWLRIETYLTWAKIHLLKFVKGVAFLVNFIVVITSVKNPDVILIVLPKTSRTNMYVFSKHLKKYR